MRRWIPDPKEVTIQTPTQGRKATGWNGTLKKIVTVVIYAQLCSSIDQYLIG